MIRSSFLLAFFVLLITELTYSQNDTLVINLKNGQAEKIALSQLQKIKFEAIVGVEDQPGNSGLKVYDNFPNPFVDLTSIDFEINSPGDVTILIYDNKGDIITTLRCTNCRAGRNKLQWNCNDNNNLRVQGGVYYYEVHSGAEVQSRKMIMVK